MILKGGVTMYLAIGWTLCLVMLICAILLTLNALTLEERLKKLRKRSSN